MGQCTEDAREAHPECLKKSPPKALLRPPPTSMTIGIRKDALSWLHVQDSKITKLDVHKVCTYAGKTTLIYRYAACVRRYINRF